MDGGRPTWQYRGACRDVDPETFFPRDRKPRNAVRAQEVCGACPVQTDCLAWALDTKQRHGVWGGLSERQIEAELTRRRAADAVGEQRPEVQAAG